MEYKRGVYDFAVKWCDKFRDKNINYTELVDHYMTDECIALGFEIDCGQAFEEVYGDAVHDYEELDKIIDDVKDIKILGSAIYSRWRYFNHWAYDGSEILEFNNRWWFILALSRLAILTEENPYIFKGTPKKLCIISNKNCDEHYPILNDIVEQHITINSDGRVWFSGYAFGDVEAQQEKAQTKNYKIEKETAEHVLNKVATYFSNDYDKIYATDVGSWELEITNTEGKVYKFSGSLCNNFVVDGVDLSDLIRDSLEIDDLYVFDGRFKPDKINKIIVDYHRVKIIKPKKPKNEKNEYVTWDYTEQLIIDRETESIEHIKNTGTGCNISHKYNAQSGISELLDDLDPDYLFEYKEDISSDFIDTPNETKENTITIDFKKKPQRIIKGTFDKNGLPDDFSDFAESVLSFIRFRFYGFGDILNPSVYEKVRRRNGEYIYCSVTFDEGYKSYYYITDDDSIQVGDYVVAPAGSDSHTAIVKVVDIEYFSEDDVPLALDKTKHIIRKCTEEDMDI